ncbi:MAG: hypothetical protein WCP20_23385 [Desulfuromonadales bacterium]
MTAAANRFTEMFQENKVVGEKPSKKRGQIDFGESLDEDQEITALFKSLHGKPEVNSQQTTDQSATLPASSNDEVDTTHHIHHNTNRNITHDTTDVTNHHKNHDITSITNRNTTRFTTQIKNRNENQVTYQETNQQTGFQPNIQTGIDTDIQTGSDTSLHSGTETYKPSHIPSGIQPGLDTGMYANINPELWYPFSPHQGAVLLYLIECGGRSNKLHIVKDTGVPYGTVQRTVALLGKKGYITNIQRYYNHKQRGFTFSINQQQCAEFYTRLKGKSGIQPTIYTNIETSIQTGVKVKPYSDIQTDVYSAQQVPFSSSRSKETTTTVFTGPEMAYWEEQGLHERQTQKWCEEFTIEPAELRQQLAWARWDLVNNGKEAEVKKDAISWFYGVLKRSAGCYPRPKDYQTPIQIRTRMLKEQLEEENQARAELVTLEEEGRFRAVLADPEGDEYQQLLASLPNAMRDMKGRALESVLRERFLAKAG